MNNLFTDASTYSQRMEHLEQGVVDAIRKVNDPSAAKRYVQQHDDAPPTLRRLYRYAKQVIVWKDKRKERLALRQKQLMDAAVDDQVFCLSHTEEMVDRWQQPMA